MALQDTCDAIASMRIRGAEAIGVAAAQALAEHVAEGGDVDAGHRRLLATRPTAVTLRRAIDHVRDAARSGRDPLAAARGWATASQDALAAVVRHAETLVSPGEHVLTHCHSSTVVSALVAAHRAHGITVTCTETRPFDQGRITSRALADNGVPVTLVVDSAVASLLPVDRVVVGADTVAREGTLFNKVGTLGVARLARGADVPFHCLTTTHKFSPDAPEHVRVEERPTSEVWPDAPPDVRIGNRVFDRTPPELIASFVTEHGVQSPEDAIHSAWRTA